jgi:hypothetical protein
MTQRLPSWDAGVLTDATGVGAAVGAGSAVGVGAWGSVTDGAGGATAGLVVGAGAARTTRAAEAPMFPPPQRPLMV